MTMSDSNDPSMEQTSLLERPGARLSYTRRGSGAAILFLQGVGLMGSAWRPQIDELARTFRTITPDNRGIGASTILSGALSIEAMAEDALAVMDAEGINLFHVVGHSMGGLIAQEVALRAPARVKSLSLLCTFLHGRQGARMTPSMIWAGLRTRLGSRAMRRKAFLELVVPTSFLEVRGAAALGDELARMFGRDLAEQPPIILKQVRAMGSYDASARLGALSRVPTLVASAELDRLALPAFGRELAAAIPGARYVELSGAGHAVPVLDPASINGLLLDHFASATRAA